jgi:hypothetical protein
MNRVDLAPKYDRMTVAAKKRLDRQRTSPHPSWTPDEIQAAMRYDVACIAVLIAHCAGFARELAAR